MRRGRPPAEIGFLTLAATQRQTRRYRPKDAPGSVELGMVPPTVLTPPVAYSLKAEALFDEFPDGIEGEIATDLVSSSARLCIPWAAIVQTGELATAFCEVEDERLTVAQSALCYLRVWTSTHDHAHLVRGFRKVA